MVKLKDILKEKDFLTDRISTQVRTIGFGLIVLIWGLLIGSAKDGKLITGCARTHLIIVGILSLVAMVLDYLQYFMGHLFVKETYDMAEKKGEEQEIEWEKIEGEYDTEDWRYKARLKLFNVKQYVMWVALVWFIAVAIAIIHNG